MPHAPARPLLAVMVVQVSRAGLALALALVLPVLVHAIPWEGSVPLGARLLPMFVAPALVAVMGWGPWAVVATVAAPWVNNLLTGRPEGAMLAALSLELAVFGAVVAGLWQVRSARRAAFVLLPAAYLLATAVAGGLLGAGAMEAALSAPGRSWPGLVVLSGLGGAAAMLAGRQLRGQR